MGEIEEEREEKVPCLNCFELFDTEYIKKHTQTCHLYEKIIQNGLEYSICTKSFKRKCDVKKHIFDSHREMVELNLSSTQISSTQIISTQRSSTQISSTQISSTQNIMANIPSLLMVQRNVANSATQNEIPALETEIGKEPKKKVQCQHCSEVFNKKYITSHVRK